jgi:hypothetical protein
VPIGDPDMALIRLLGDPPVPGAAQLPNEIIERPGVSNLLQGQGVGNLAIDGRLRGSSRLEQVVDVPGHQLEHG